MENTGNCKQRTYFLSEIYKIKDNEIVYIAKDITDSVLLYKQEKREKIRFETLINTIDVGITITDKKGVIKYINNKTEKILELEANKEITTVFELFKTEEEKNDITSYFYNINKPENSCVDCALEIVARRNRKKWINISAGIMVMEDEYIVLSFTDITYRHSKEQEIEYLSFHDDLTGVYNRRFFREELERLFNNKRVYPLALIMFDINGLKMVNDMLGHHWGDKLLKKAADIFFSTSRSNDIPARIGGDEFVVLMPNTNESGIKTFLRRMNKLIDKENKKENSIYLSISMGFAVQDGQFVDIDKFYTAADKAMYKDKYSKSRKDELDKILQSIKKFRAGRKIPNKGEKIFFDR